jgi:4a-hydroxytetrahydrobiopterin dehydratase
MYWIEKDNQLRATFKFTDFIQAFSFMTQVAIHAEKMNHHPTWSNTYDTVHFELCTHDEGNIVTMKDKLFADRITQLYQHYSK